jgi:hypothetical protein
MSSSIFTLRRRYRQYVPEEHWYASARLNGVVTHNTIILIFIPLQASSFNIYIALFSLCKCSYFRIFFNGNWRRRTEILYFTLWNLQCFINFEITSISHIWIRRKWMNHSSSFIIKISGERRSHFQKSQNYKVKRSFCSCKPTEKYYEDNSTT